MIFQMYIFFAIKFKLNFRLKKKKEEEKKKKKRSSKFCSKYKFNILNLVMKFLVIFH